MTKPTSDQPAPGGHDRVALGLLFVALVIGLTRFVGLGQWSLWLDEALTLADSLHRHGEGLKNPLGYGLFRVWLETLGGRPSELELRLPAAVVGYLTLPLVYWVFAPFTGRRAAAGAALLLACSSWHAYWSQMARFYTLAQALSLLGCGLVLRGLLARSTARVVAGVAVAGAACTAHLSGAFPLPALMVAPLLLARVGVQVPGAASRAGRVLLVLGAVGLVVGVLEGREVWRVWRIIRGEGTPAHFLLSTGFFVTPLLGVGAGLGALVALRRRRPFELYVLAVVVLGLGTAMLVATLARLSAQYVFVLLPWICALAALPLALSAEEPRPERTRTLLAYLVLLALPSLVTVGLYHTVRQGERPQWRSAYRLVANQREPDDLILGMEAPVGEYYLSADNTDLRNQLQLAYLDSFRADLPDRWARYDRRIWLVLNREQLADWDRADASRLKTTLAQRARLVASFPLIIESRDLSVYVYLIE